MHYRPTVSTYLLTLNAVFMIAQLLVRQATCWGKPSSLARAYLSTPGNKTTHAASSRVHTSEKTGESYGKMSARMPDICPSDTCPSSNRTNTIPVTCPGKRPLTLNPNPFVQGQMSRHENVTGFVSTLPLVCNVRSAAV